MEADAAVVRFVLQCIDDIEAGGPEENGKAQQDGGGTDLAAHRDPGPDGRHREAEAEDEVAQRGEALRVRIEEEDGECDRRQ